jgi:Xaa-Pro dipeptidase
MRLAKLLVDMHDQGIDFALLSSLASLRYFAGFTASIETGPSPFFNFPGALFVASDVQPVLFVAGSEATENIYDGILIEHLPDYTIDTPPNFAEAFVSRITKQLQGYSAGKAGIEFASIPAGALKEICIRCPRIEWKDLSETTTRLRALKDDHEVRILRECCALCDKGQMAVKKLVQPGMTEIELFASVREEMEKAAGGRMPLLADLISGERTSSVGGSPSMRELKLGDLVISDLAPRHHGYWGDSCNTCSVGEAGKEQIAQFKAISEILWQATEMIRPGLRACDLDAFVRGRVRMLGGEFPHHTGHGIGVTWHEEPRIVPYNQQRLEANMVIALEPGVYFPGRWGIRLEHVVRVTPDGAEVLSNFRHIL